MKQVSLQSHADSIKLQLDESYLKEPSLNWIGSNIFVLYYQKVHERIWKILKNITLVLFQMYFVAKSTVPQIWQGLFFVNLIC